ncbi:unnamed protein product [Clonostachys solani]|uniref:Uncharacterized protein n=1 Tax=Clonostachys solani TaxID=160281 RepID=A0A9P0EKI9_9HYPO|nr:unnamed protein product [Clonostachys solani]
MSKLRSDSDEEAQVFETAIINQPPRWQDTLADSSPFVMGAVATTLLTVSFGMLNLRDVTLQAPVFVADLCFAAGAGLIISAQWEMLKGNTFSYTVLMAFGFFYSGYGYVTIPSTGIADFYGGFATPSFNNALGSYVLIWACFNLFFLLCTTRMYVLDLQKHPVPFALSYIDKSLRNITYVGIFSFVELCLIFDAASYFASAEGKIELGTNFMKASGGFAFAASILCYYTVLHYLCEDALPFRVPLGDLTKYKYAHKRTA